MGFLDPDDESRSHGSSAGVREGAEKLAEDAWRARRVVA